ncbi:MAG TPA: hypothetical protein DCM05_17410 [Elusimicrobia bacterium]|nr:hypothetical protein [Elusimicrobiota bacterium]
MGFQKKPASIAGPMLLLLIVLLDVGLIVLGWHIRQQKKAEYSLAGLNMAAPPRQLVPFPVDLPPEAAAPASTGTILSGAPSSVIPESMGPRTAQPPAQAAQAPAAASSWMERAENLYYKLKKSSRFRSSTAIKGWKKEFLGHADLAAIDARYRKDGDASRFIKDMARSPNFRSMLGRYLVVPDFQEFVKELAMKPDVMAAGKTVLDDAAVMDTLKSLKVPGLPPIGQMMEMGKQIQDSGAKDSSAAIQQMKSNPALQQMLQGQGISPDALQNAQSGKR